MSFRLMFHRPYHMKRRAKKGRQGQKELQEGTAQTTSLKKA